MARKRSAVDAQEEQDRAYALSVAAAMAASEESDDVGLVHTPSVKKKLKKSSSATSNGHHQSTPPVRKKTPVKPTAAAPARPATPSKAAAPPAQRTPVKKSAQPSSAVKREKKEKPQVVKYEPPPPQYEEEDDEEEEEDDSEIVEDVEEELEEEEEEEEEDEEEEEEEIAAPVVFQCGTCRSIFGDSYAFVCSNAELLLVTLSAVTNIALSPEAHTSRDSADRGSSFHELLCKQCQTVLGRQYLTTTRALDAIRSLYSFSTSAIASYQLGYPQLSQVENGSSDTLPTVDEIKSANQKCDEAVQVMSLDRQALLKLRDDMTKVQSLLVVVDERLHQLEAQAEDSEQEPEHEEEDDDTAVDPLTRTKRPKVSAGHRSPPY